MPNFQLICDGTQGLCVGFYLQAQDNATPPDEEPATGSATIDRYDIAILAPAGGNAFQILPRAAMTPGQPTQTVTASFAVNDAASGKPLTPNPLTIAVDFVAPLPAQVAFNLVVVTPPTRGTGSILTDPGSATIPVSLT